MKMVFYMLIKLQKQINELKHETNILKENNQQLFRSFRKGCPQTINNNTDHNPISSLTTTNSNLNTPILQAINKHLEMQNLHNDIVSCLLLTSQHKRIITGSKDGSVSVCSVDYTSNTYQQILTKSNAHNDWIYYLNEISNQRLLSCSYDHLIKVWNIDDLNLITTLTKHTDWVTQVIPLTNNRFASFSYGDQTVKLWCDLSYEKIPTPFEQQNNPRALLQLNNKAETLCISCGKDGKGCIYFYNLVPPYNKQGTINGVYTGWRFGMVQLSNGDIALSKWKPTPSIIIVDTVNYIQLAEIIDNEYINKEGPGALCLLGEYSFIYVRQGCLCQIMKGNSNAYEIVFKTKEDEGELIGYGGIMALDNDKYIAVSTDNGKNGINVYKCNY